LLQKKTKVHKVAAISVTRVEKNIQRYMIVSDSRHLVALQLIRQQLTKNMINKLILNCNLDKEARNTKHDLFNFSFLRPRYLVAAFSGSTIKNKIFASK
jgi:hypothetical protein